MSEVAVAARPILEAERKLASARSRAGTPGQFAQGFHATDAVAYRWGKRRKWLEWILKVHCSVADDPQRFGSVVSFLDSGGAPNVAWASIIAARNSESDINLPALKRHGRELLTDAWVGRWSPVDIDMAARALLESRIGHGPILGHIFDPAQRKVLNDIAKLWGERADFLLRIFDVCDAAAADPERFGPLVQTMCRVNNPSGAWGTLKRSNDEQRCLNLVPVTGRYKTLIFDPPWNEDNISAVAGHDYALMSFDQIRNLPVDQWADDECHLYLWYTNNIFPLMPDLLRKWGFDYKTNHTWVKETGDLERNDPKFGLGRYFRNTTEQFLFATRGARSNLPRRSKSRATPTHHRWPVGINSEKPDAFYDLVRECSYPAFGEAFQRTPRPDFVNLYQPAPALILEAAE